MSGGKRINCRRCKFFYITWDRRVPNGCRAYAIKTRYSPAVVVLKATGKGCVCYAPKQQSK